MIHTRPARAAQATLLAPLALTFLAVSARGQGVVLNEFVYDNVGAGSDTLEYVEIYNGTGAPVDLSGWIVEGRDTDPGTVDPIYSVPPGTPPVPAGGYYVMGTANVPGVNQVLSPTFGRTDLFDDDTEALLLCDNRIVIMDSLVYEAFRGIDGLRSYAEGEGIWGAYQSLLPGGGGVPTSLSRVRDGHDTNDNRDFVLLEWTPGASNNLPINIGSRDRFNLAAGQPVNGWSGSLSRPVVVDPTVVSAANTYAIPPSNQGGNVAIFGDPTPVSPPPAIPHTGQAFFALTDGESEDVLVEATVWFDAQNEAIGEREAWSLGVQGTVDSHCGSPDPIQYWSLIENGQTGVSWVYQTSEQGGILFLVEHGNGGWGLRPQSGPRVHASIPVRPGLNDGWQRLRLQVLGDRVVGMFGGIPGCVGGTRVEFVLQQPARGTVYVGYARDGFTGPPGRPFTCDDLLINAGSTSGLFRYGQGTPNTVSQSRIDINSFPALGNQAFALLISGTKPGNGLAQIYLSPFATLPGYPLDLSLLGAQANAVIYVPPYQVDNCTSNGQGVVVKSAPIPCEPLIRGTSLFLQYLEIDIALPQPLPIATSQPVQLFIG